MSPKDPESFNLELFNKETSRIKKEKDSYQELNITEPSQKSEI